MSERPENPPAFPFEYDGPHHLWEGETERTTHPGMTLRDWFAGQALAAVGKSWDWSRPDEASELAARMYRIADAMLATRTGDPA